MCQYIDDVLWIASYQTGGCYRPSAYQYPQSALLFCYDKTTITHTEVTAIKYILYSTYTQKYKHTHEEMTASHC